jgi:hypothetical protein
LEKFEFFYLVFKPNNIYMQRFILKSIFYKKNI